MRNLFDFLFKRKKTNNSVAGTLEYIPGSQTPDQDLPISLENGELIKRMYVQPEAKNKADHTSIPIFTGNPFRDMKLITSLHQL
jgi:hypothetical protein